MTPYTPLHAWKDRLDAGEITAVDLASLYLERIAAHNERLNAFVHLDAEHVLAQAQASDAHRAKHGARALEGLPVAVKDIFCTEGTPTTAVVWPAGFRLSIFSTGTKRSWQALLEP